MVSMKDVAAACGVSVATVSKALSNHRDIGEKTRKLVKETAEQMGYLPNQSARYLKTNRSYNIGVLFEDAAGSGLTPVSYTHLELICEVKRRVKEMTGVELEPEVKLLGDFPQR